MKKIFFLITIAVILSSSFFLFSDKKAEAATFVDFPVTLVSSGNGAGNYTFNVNFNITIGALAEKVEIIPVSADNGLRLSFNSDVTVFQAGDCPWVVANTAGVDIKSKLVDGANTASGSLDNTCAICNPGCGCSPGCVGGPYSASIILRVFYADPSCTLSSSESAVLPNDTVILSWTAADAVSGTINGVNATPIASGSMISSPIVAPTAFTMSVTGPGGSGTCGPINVDLISPPIGGLVPCGRMGDNPNTPYNESEPCTLCHIFIMLQMIVTFVVEIGGIIAVFFLVIGGLIYSTSAGDQGRMETGKKAMMWALFGLAIILLSWLIVTIVLTAFGYVNPLGGQWNIVNCSV